VRNDSSLGIGRVRSPSLFPVRPGISLKI
jgi:hypothetical protein